MRETILAKLAEVEDMIAEAECDGKSLPEHDNAYRDIMDKLSALTQAVDYYVD
jgi:hypothetical protein